MFYSVIGFTYIFRHHDSNKEADSHSSRDKFRRIALFVLDFIALRREWGGGIPIKRYAVAFPPYRAFMRMDSQGNTHRKNPYA